MKKENKTIMARAAMLLLVAVLTFFACPNQARAWEYVNISGTAGNSYENGEDDDGNTIIVTESCENLFDNNPDTKWCVVGVPSSIWVEFSTDEAITPKGYELTTGNDTENNPGRRPRTWILYAKAEGSNEWTVLSSVTNDNKLPGKSKDSASYYFYNKTEYQHFRLEISEIQGGDVFELSEFELLTEVPEGEKYNFVNSELLGLQRVYHYTGSAITLTYSLIDVAGNTIDPSKYDVVLYKDGQVTNDDVKDFTNYLLKFTAKANSGYTGTKEFTFEVLPWASVGGWCGKAGDGKNVYYEITNPNNVTTLTIRKNPSVATDNFEMKLYDPYNWIENKCNFAPWITAVPHYYEDGEFDEYALSSDIEKVVIEEGVTSVGSGAFFYCEQLKTATIPASVTTIGDFAFNQCTALEDVYCYADPDALTWEYYENCDFAANNATKFHVYENKLVNYQAKFGDAKVTFVGDIPAQKTYQIDMSADLTSINLGTKKVTIEETIALPYTRTLRECIQQVGGQMAGMIVNNYNHVSDVTKRDEDTNVAIGTPNDWDTPLTITGDGTAIVTVTTTMGTIPFTITTTRSFAVTANNANGAYWATFYSSEGNFKVQTTGTEVFAVHLDGTTLTMNEISDGIVNQGKGVVLKGSASSIVLKEVTSASTDEDYGTNSLTGTDNGVVNPGNAFALGYSADNGVGFYKLTDTGIIGANKAYLTYDGTLDTREFFTFGEANGIDATAIDHSPLTIDHYYDLQGRRVDHPTKGLYIVNGRKVVVK